MFLFHSGTDDSTFDDSVSDVPNPKDESINGKKNFEKIGKWKKEFSREKKNLT